MVLKSVHNIVTEKVWDDTANNTYYKSKRVWMHVWFELDDANWHIIIQDNLRKAIEDQIRKDFNEILFRY